MLGYYYKDDSDVQRDTELQTWVLEIFEHGFLSRPESGELQSKYINSLLGGRKKYIIILGKSILQN